MGLKEYNVIVGNTPTTMQLSDEDAERFGVTAKDLVKAEKPAAASAPRAPRARAAKPAAKARTPRNKAVKPAENKAAAAAENATDPGASEA